MNQEKKSEKIKEIQSGELIELIVVFLGMAALWYAFGFCGMIGICWIAGQTKRNIIETINKKHQ